MFLEIVHVCVVALFGASIVVPGLWIIRFNKETSRG
jgi:hypothetical protein